MRGIYEKHSVICNGVTDERARFWGYPMRFDWYGSSAAVAVAA